MMPDFSYDNSNASSVNFELARYFDQLFPKQDSLSISVPMMPGELELLSKFLPREIPASGVLYKGSGTLQAAIDNFSSFLCKDTAKELIFNDKTDRFYLAKHIDTVELQRRGAFVPLQLKFICKNPLGYAVTPTTVTKSGVVTDNYTWTIVNAGQYYAWPVITITFHQAQSHIYIKNTSITNCRFDVSKSFLNNDVLVVDSWYMTINLNGSYSPAGFGDGGDSYAGMILIQKGNNTFQVGTDDASINVDVSVTYRKTYL